MRIGMWCLVVCGLVGVALSVGNAEDGLLDKYRSTLNPKRLKRRTFDFFSRNAKDESKADKKEESGTKPIPNAATLTGREFTPNAAAPKSLSNPRVTTGFDRFAPRQQTPSRYLRRRGPNNEFPGTRSQSGIGKPPVKNYHKQLFGGRAPSGGDRSKPIADSTTGTATKRTFANDAARTQRSTQSSPPFSDTTTNRFQQSPKAGYRKTLRLNNRQPAAGIGKTDAAAVGRPAPAGTNRSNPRLTNNRGEIRGSSNAQNEKKLIHAQHNRGQGNSLGGIQQIRVSEQNRTPLRTPGEVTKRKSRPPAPAPGKRRLGLDFADQATQKTQPANTITPSLYNGPGLALHDKAEPGSPTVSLQWIKKSDINVGQECHCHLIVKNTGRGVAKDVVVDAYFPTSVRLTSVAPQPAEARDHLSWLFNSLAPGETHTIEIKMIPSQRGDVATTARARFTGTASGLFQVEEPLLEVAVKGPSDVLLGDPASQIVTVTNPGTGVARNVSLEVRIPDGLEHPRGERLMMDIGSLNPGESRTVRLSLVAVNSGEKTLRIDAQAASGIKRTAVAKVNVIAPSLQVAVNGPGLRYLGRAARYIVAVTNNGTAATNNVRVIHKLPDGFKFVKADKGGKLDESNQAINWFVGALKPGESARLNVQLSTTALGEFTHQVAAVSEQGVNTESQIVTRVEGTASLLLEIIDLDDPVEVGRETAYEIRVRNSGSKSAQNVGVSCELPAGIELVRAKGATGHISEKGLLIFKPLRELAPGKTALYRVHVQGTVEGNLRIRARLTSDSIQEPLVFEELTKFYAD